MLGFGTDSRWSDAEDEDEDGDGDGDENKMKQSEESTERWKVVGRRTKRREVDGN